MSLTLRPTQASGASLGVRSIFLPKLKLVKNLRQAAHAPHARVGAWPSSCESSEQAVAVITRASLSSVSHHWERTPRFFCDRALDKRFVTTRITVHTNVSCNISD